VGTDAKYWNRLYFGASQSVRDYYQEVSYGQLDLVPAEETHGIPNDGLVGWIKLPYAHPNPADEINIGNEDIAEDALFFADKYVDFKLFDKNGNGALSTRELLLVLIIAGYEASYETVILADTCAPSVWSHVSAFDSEKAPIQDGVRIASSEHGGAYAQSGEWHCTEDEEPGHAATMGVLAHEIGHLLGDGAPDLYDRDGSSAGVGNWDLMGNGSWNGIEKAGDRPAHLSAWTKSYFGWITPKLVTSSIIEASIPAIETQSDGVYQLLENPGGVDWEPGISPGRGEYFLIENRQKIGYDAALPASGLLVWHIDESQADNKDDRKKLVDLVEASQEQDLDCLCNDNFGDAADPFPGTNNLRALDDQTSPSLRLLSGVPSRLAISHISDSGPIMTADFAVTQVRPGDPWLIFDETFENGSEWLPSKIVELIPSDHCGEQGRPASQAWYFGDSELCHYGESGQLVSDKRPLPAGATKLTLQFSHYLDLHRLDRVELNLSFDGGKKWRRAWAGGRPVAKKEWKTVTVRAPVPKGSTAVLLRFSLIKTPRSTGGAGWFLDDVKVFSAVGVKRSSVTAWVGLVLRFNLGAETASVELRIFTLRGQLIYSAEGEARESLHWHLEDFAEKPVPNGVYFYVLSARDREGQLITRRMQKISVTR
jgi:M6 family metalloprotease-like protein